MGQGPFSFFHLPPSQYLQTNTIDFMYVVTWTNCLFWLRTQQMGERCAPLAVCLFLYYLLLLLELDSFSGQLRFWLELFSFQCCAYSWASASSYTEFKIYKRMVNFLLKFPVSLFPLTSIFTFFLFHLQFNCPTYGTYYSVAFDVWPFCKHIVTPLPPASEAAPGGGGRTICSGWEDAEVQTGERYRLFIDPFNRHTTIYVCLRTAVMGWGVVDCGWYRI